MPYRIISAHRKKQGIKKLQINQGSNCYTYEFAKYYRGKKYRRQLTIPAKIVEREYKAWLDEVYEVKTIKNTLKKSATLYQAYTEKNKSRVENNKIKLYLGYLVNFFPQDKVIERLSVWDFDEFTSFLKNLYPNPATYNRALSVITTFFNFLNHRDIKAPMNILVGRSLREISRGMKLLSKKQITTLLERTRYSHQRTFLMLALFTGMRHQEILTLKWEDVFLKEKYIKLKAENTKTKTARIIPIVNDLSNHLSRLTRESPYLVSYGGKKLVTFRKTWITITKGLDWAKDLRIHDLRHHFITLLFSKNINPYEIRAIAGHSDIKMTMRYAELSEGFQEKRAKEISRKIGD